MYEKMKCFSREKSFVQESLLNVFWKVSSPSKIPRNSLCVGQPLFTYFWDRMFLLLYVLLYIKQHLFLSRTLQGPLTLQPFYCLYCPRIAFPGIFSCERSRIMLWLLFSTVLLALRSARSWQIALASVQNPQYLQKNKIHLITFNSFPWICVIRLILSQKREKKLFSHCLFPLFL